MKESPRRIMKDSSRLKLMLKTGELPKDIAEKIDMDRIKEAEENFLETDRKRTLALNKKILKPLLDNNDGNIIKRSIVGDRS